MIIKKLWKLSYKNKLNIYYKQRFNRKSYKKIIQNWDDIRDLIYYNIK